MGTTRRMLGQTKRQLLTETHCYEVCFPFLSFVVGPLPYLHPSPLHLSIYLSIYNPPPPPPPSRPSPSSHSPLHPHPRRRRRRQQLQQRAQGREGPKGGGGVVIQPLPLPPLHLSIYLSIYNPPPPPPSITFFPLLPLPPPPHPRRRRRRQQLQQRAQGREGPKGGGGVVIRPLPLPRCRAGAGVDDAEEVGHVRDEVGRHLAGVCLFWCVFVGERVGGLVWGGGCVLGFLVDNSGGGGGGGGVWGRCRVGHGQGHGGHAQSTWSCGRTWRATACFPTAVE